MIVQPFLRISILRKNDDALVVPVDAELRLRDISSKKILLEVAMLKAIEARNAVSLDAVLKQLNQLRGGATGGPAVPAAAPVAGARSIAPRVQSDALRSNA